MLPLMKVDSPEPQNGSDLRCSLATLACSVGIAGL